MDTKFRGANSINPENEIDKVAIDYKLKLIAFQDEIFRARKRLQDSDRRIAVICESLDTYIQNKENQMAEVMLTARMNVQRIEAQARNQVEYFLLQIEEEINNKEQDLQDFEKQASEKGLVLTEILEIREQESGERLKTVKENKPGTLQSVSVPKGERVIIPILPLEPVATTADTPLTEATVGEVMTNALASLPEIRLVPPPPTEEITSALTPDIQENEETEPASPQKKRVVAKKAGKTRAERNRSLLGGESEPVHKDEPGIHLETAEPVAAGTRNMPPVEIGLPEDCQSKEVVETLLVPVDEPVQEPLRFQPPPPVAPNEILRMDAFLDVRYYDNDSDNKQIQHHALQVTVDVEVPEETYGVRYSKVNSDIVYALLRFDNVVLNDMFPFNFIAPKPESIATYFFNYMEDTLGMMDLRLQALTLLEIPDLCIQITSRNTVLDNMLHKDEDKFEELRATLLPCVEPEPSDSPDLKKRLNRLFGKR